MAVSADFGEVEWDKALIDDCRQLVRLAIREDLGRLYDWTTVSLVPEAAQARAIVRSRCAGVVAGILAAQLALAEYDPELAWSLDVADGDTIEAGATIATISGSARNLLTAAHGAQLTGPDVRHRHAHECFRRGRRRHKSPHLRHAQNRAGLSRPRQVRRAPGGGHNHRRGLYDGILIKDNHLAFGTTGGTSSPAAAIDRCRQVVAIWRRRADPDRDRSRFSRAARRGLAARA